MENKKVLIQSKQIEEYKSGAENILYEYGYQLIDQMDKEIIIIQINEWNKDKLLVKKQDNICEIYCQKRVHFFRGLSILLDRIQENIFELEEIVRFESNGIMIDCARNGVPRIETLKKYVRYLAQLGMNRLYLYLEDVIELDGYPYWGYLRGRYTKTELKDLNAYAQQFGIDVIPCIQTLAHLRSALKQPAFYQYKDIDDILLLEDSKSQELLSELLETIADCFSSKIVHLGMDEAMNLGRGKYLDQHGLVPPAEIMKKHLNWLQDKCKCLDLQPMIWSDMYLKLNFGVEDYYGIAEDAVPEDSNNLSKEIGLCYWDYYNETTEFYEKFISVHKQLGNPIIFAGGAWTWNGIAPNTSKAVKTTKDALTACISKQVKDVFCTVWMDNGAETPLDTCLPAITWFGEYGFGDQPDEERIKKRFEQIFHKNYVSYVILDAFDNVENKMNGSIENLNNKYAINPSKTILYEDPLMGQFSQTFDEQEMKEHYKVLRSTLALEKTGDRVIEYYKVLVELLFKKADISRQIHIAYANKDREKLTSLCGTLTEIQFLAESVSTMRSEIWMRDNKPFGYEVLDIRLAGVRTRAISAQKRIEDYISGNIDVIEELEERILPVKTKEMLQKEVLHGYYIWDRIISNCNIDGI